MIDTLKIPKHLSSFVTVRFHTLMYVNLDPEPFPIIPCSVTNTALDHKYVDEEFRHNYLMKKPLWR